MAEAVSGVQVLIVDDDESLRSLMARWLASEGHKVFEAASGWEAGQVLSQGVIDVVLLDAVLPDADGREMCRRLKGSRRPGGPLLILISGLMTTSQDHADALECGADLFLSKPIEKRVLLAQVRAMVRLRRAEEALRTAYDDVTFRVRQATADLRKANENLRTEVEARRKVEDELFERLRFERLVSDLSAEMTTLSPERLEESIGAWLRRIVECLDVDRSTLLRWSEEAGSLRTLQSYAGHGVPPPPETDLGLDLPWYAERVKKGEPLVLERLPDDLPKEAVAERAYCRRTGIKSHLAVPLRAGDRCLGVIGVATFRGPRHWSPDLVDRVRLVGDIFAGTLLRIEAGKRLRSERDRLLEAQRIAHLGNWEWDIPANRLQWSDEIFRIFGLSPAEFGATYETFLGAVHPDDREKVRLEVERSLADPEAVYSIEHRVLRPDGETRTVHERGEVTFDESGKPIRMLGTVQDITELKATQEELRRSEERFRAIADYGYDWEIWTEPDGSLAWTNPAVERITGYTVEEYRNLPERLQIFSTDDEREPFQTFFERTIRERKTANDVPLHVRHRDGTIRMVTASYQPIYGDDGKYLGIRASIRDVTERKQVELEAQRLREELARVARASTMGELAASFAHQLNQPLAAILSNAQAALRFLRGDPPDTEEVRGALEDIVEDDRRAGEVIQRLRALYRKKEIERTPLDVNEVVQEVVSMVRSQALLRRVSVDLRLEEGLPAVSGDRVQLQQVILNLIVNGIDAMAEVPARSRRLTVETASPDAGSVRVSVRDVGPGFGEEDLGRVFEPLYTTKPEGMGMGLPISRSIVRAHGGEITAANHPHGGAVLSIVLKTTPKEESA